MIISILALCLSGIAIIVTIIMFRITHRTSIQPIIVFSRRSRDKWEIQNVGNGPAINVKIFDGNEKKEWVEVIDFYPIAAGAVIKIDWRINGWIFAATYEDVYKRSYTSYCIDEQTRIFKKNLYPNIKITKREYDLERV